MSQHLIGGFIIMDEQRFSYKQKVFIPLFGMVFFGVVSYVMAGFASETNIGLKFYPIIDLSVRNTIIFYWALTVIFATISFLKLILIIKSMTATNELILNKNHIRVPKGGMSNKMITVEFAHIYDIRLQKVQVNSFLTLFHHEGELTVISSFLSQEEDFKHIAYYVIDHSNCKIKPLIKPSM